jgi:hypothetical protein
MSQGGLKTLTSTARSTTKDAPMRPRLGRRYLLADFCNREAMSEATVLRWAKRKLVIIEVRYSDPTLDDA